MGPQTEQQQRPRDVVVVLLDSLNRHMLGSYGGKEFDTPNLDRLARRAVRFTNHHTGSLPCMPARHDLLVGALDFPWRPWGSIETWEDAVTVPLSRQRKITTMLVSDHPHLFESGGENYHTDFTGWDYVRGHEDDAWRTRSDPSHAGTPMFPAIRPGQVHRSYETARTWFREEEDFPGPKTMREAAAWLDRELTADRQEDERFLLFVDEFDPHEPFDTPEPWASLYDPDWEGERIIWPPYATDAESAGLTERESRHLRSQYGAKLSMIDHWFGRILDVLDKREAWDTTALVLCTDHGHYLGERGMWGKPQVPVFPELGHIPLLIAWPGVEPATCDALTTTVDIHATICDTFEVTSDHTTHGRSMRPLLDGSASSIREWALCGVWGREMHVADRTRTFARAPVRGNRPISMYSNRWSTMPIRFFPELRLPRPDSRAQLDRVGDSNVPVIRQPFDSEDMLPFWGLGRFSGDLLYDRFEADSTGVVRNRADGPEAGEMTDLLVEALRDIRSPAEQFERLGIS